MTQWHSKKEWHTQALNVRATASFPAENKKVFETKTHQINFNLNLLLLGICLAFAGVVICSLHRTSCSLVSIFGCSVCYYVPLPLLLSHLAIWYLCFGNRWLRFVRFVSVVRCFRLLQSHSSNESLYSTYMYRPFHNNSKIILNLFWLELAYLMPLFLTYIKISS